MLTRGGSRDFEKGGRGEGEGGGREALYVGRHGWPTKKILGLRWFEKVKITLVTNFWRNISISIFKFSPIIFNENLPMKFYQFFEICKRFGKERGKTLIQQSMRKEKLIKVRLCFIASCFIIPFKMVIIFFISQAHS